MSLQERTLVVKNFDPEKTTINLLKELCIQGGPVRNVVIKPDHAFVEYEDTESVGYSKALLDGVILFGKRLIMEPKTRYMSNFKYTQLLNDYIKFDKQNKQALQQQQQMMDYYAQQAQQSQQPSHPSTVNFVHNMNPNIFNYDPSTQAQFTPPNQLPSTSISRRDDNFRRSRSFNHHHQRQTNRGRSERPSDWDRRR